MKILRCELRAAFEHEPGRAPAERGAERPACLATQGTRAGIGNRVRGSRGIRELDHPQDFVRSRRADSNLCAAIALQHAGTCIA